MPPGGHPHVSPSARPGRRSHCCSSVSEEACWQLLPAAGQQQAEQHAAQQAQQAQAEGQAEEQQAQGQAAQEPQPQAQAPPPPPAEEEDEEQQQHEEGPGQLVGLFDILFSSCPLEQHMAMVSLLCTCCARCGRSC